MAGELWLIRHGETEWSLSGAHTGRTDLPLTRNGEAKARALAPKLAGHPFALVLTSPLQRARRTCELAGLGAGAQLEPDLEEWDYGEYEGLSSGDIHRDRPGWNPFRRRLPGGETIDQVAARADAVIQPRLSGRGDVALFAHGHILRILGARWLSLPPSDARLFALGTAASRNLATNTDARYLCSGISQ